MYSSLAKSVKNLLKNHQTMPQKRFGQNFLIDQGAMERILEAADIRENDLVLEIGAGIGNLTRELAKKAKKVVAIEKDLKMCEILRKLLEIEEIRNVEVVQGDIRKINPKFYLLNTKYYKVVANIPYYLTAYLIRNLLEAENPPKDMTLVMQKEVAQRVCSRPPEMNLLAVSVQFYAKPKIISYIKKSSFWPVPKVDSAIIKITPFAWAHSHYASKERASAFRMLFFKILRSGFSQPRKQLLNNLSRGLGLNREEVTSWLLKNNIQPTQRAETLSMDDWLSLTKSAFGDMQKTEVFKN